MKMEWWEQMNKYSYLLNPLNAISKSINRSICPVYIFFEPLSIKNKWYKSIKRTQLDSRNPLFMDRQKEIKEYFNKSNLNLAVYYLKNGWPNSNRFKHYYIKSFEGKTGPDKLKNAYDSIGFAYTLRLMLAYERYSMICDYLDCMISDSNKNLDQFDVLDYGCGVSDIGLLFSLFGSKVTIADLDNDRFNFVIWRFHRRGYNPQVIRISSTEIYPELPESKFDLIIATELFEHVRDPMKLLSNFTKSLKRGGYLFDSMGGRFERDDRPHHLNEAFKIGQSRRYREYYENNYLQLSPNDLPYLFKRI